MSNNYFKFKQFTVYHDKCSFKVGTDGVLLGALAEVDGKKRILDIGTGSGLVALMLAQRSEATVHAIEIDESSALQARQNFLDSPWGNRLSLECISLQDYVRQTNEPFDLIVSNPPYFENSLKNPDGRKSMARHTGSLSFEELISNVKKLLSAEGIFYVIIPVFGHEDFIDLAYLKGLYCYRKILIKPTQMKPITRVILAFRDSLSFQIIEETLILLDSKSNQTPEFYFLSKDFYLGR